MARNPKLVKFLNKIGAGAFDADLLQGGVNDLINEGGGSGGVTIEVVNEAIDANTQDIVIPAINTAIATNNDDYYDKTTIDTQLSAKIAKPSTAVVNNLAIFDAGKNVIDSAINKDILTTFNTANALVKIDADGKLPAIDGSQLTGLTGGVPSATPTVAGIAKLYDTLGSNNDGSVHQKIVTDSIKIGDTVESGTTSYAFGTFPTTAGTLANLNTFTDNLGNVAFSSQAYATGNAVANMFVATTDSNWASDYNNNNGIGKQFFAIELATAVTPVGVGLTARYTFGLANDGVYTHTAPYYANDNEYNRITGNISATTGTAPNLTATITLTNGGSTANIAVGMRVDNFVDYGNAYQPILFGGIVTAKTDTNVSISCTTAITATNNLSFVVATWRSLLDNSVLDANNFFKTRTYFKGDSARPSANIGFLPPPAPIKKIMFFMTDKIGGNATGISFINLLSYSGSQSVLTGGVANIQKGVSINTIDNPLANNSVFKVTKKLDDTKIFISAQALVAFNDTTITAPLAVFVNGMAYDLINTVAVNGNAGVYNIVISGNNGYLENPKIANPLISGVGIRIWEAY